jgi:hypothetical protein
MGGVEMTNKTNPNLFTKIAKASIAMGTFATDKENKDQNYGYISADQVLSRAGRALAEQGVVVAPTITAEATESTSYESYGKKKSRFDSVIELDMLITDGDKEITQHWIGRGVDSASPDKAMYKAITSGHKYFLMKLLNIGVGNEDGEHDAADAPQATKQPQPTQNTKEQQNGAGRASGPDTEGDNPFDDVPDVVRRQYHNMGSRLHGKDWDKVRHEQVKAVSKGERESSKELTEAEMKRLTAGMAAKLEQKLQRRRQSDRLL